MLPTLVDMAIQRLHFLQQCRPHKKENEAYLTAVIGTIRFRFEVKYGQNTMQVDHPSLEQIRDVLKMLEEIVEDVAKAL